MVSLDLELNSASFLAGAGAVNQSLTSLIAGSGRLDNALLSVGRALTDFKRIGDDVRRVAADLAEKTGKSSSAFGAMWTVIKSNPVTAIATALGVAAAALTIFSGKSNEAATSQQRLAAAIRESQSAMAAFNLRTRLGDVTATGIAAADARIQALTKIRAELPAGEMTLYELEKALGSLEGKYQPGDVRKRPVTGPLTGPDEFELMVTRTGARRIIDAELKSLYNQQRVEQMRPGTRAWSDVLGGDITPETFAERGYGATRRRTYSPGAWTPPDFLGGVSADKQYTEEYASRLEENQRRSERHLESLRARMEELTKLGQSFGYAIADGLDQAARSGANLRETIVAIGMEMSRVVFNLAATGFANALGRGFGGTAGQISDDFVHVEAPPITNPR